MKVIDGRCLDCRLLHVECDGSPADESEAFSLGCYTPPDEGTSEGLFEDEDERRGTRTIQEADL
jgi:hypothetical protein